MSLKNSNVYTEMSIDDYERVIFCENETAKLKAFIAIHNTKLGPSLGGCRLWNYENQQQALTDVLRLSKGMTYKNALAGLKLGGGKSIIWADSNQEKTLDLLEAMAEFVETLQGKYIIAEDVGINVGDVNAMRQFTEYTANPIAGNPGPVTALGVYAGIKAACKHKLGVDSLENVKIIIEGVGSVGSNLIRCLMDQNVDIYAFDINKDKLNSLVNEYNITPLNSIEEIYQECDVYAPCALGAVINDETLPKFNCKIVAGAANNQLLESRHGQALKDKNILYAPDYVINAGGVILIDHAQDVIDVDYEIINSSVLRIGDVLLNIFEESDKTGIATHIIADKIAEDILNGK